MKINWNKNPLKTTIELDEHEQEVFKLKIKVKEMEEALCSASIHLDPANASWVMKENYRRTKPHTIETLIAEVRKDYLNMDYILGEGKDERSLDGRVDEMFQYYMDDLASYHVGDCTCVPCSCTKCHAEDLLGINTIKGLGKHAAYKVDAAFGKDNERTIDEALESLRSYNPTRPADMSGWDKVGGWDKHLPRWKTEATSAYDWLLNYRNEHFKEQA